LEVALLKTSKSWVVATCSIFRVVQLDSTMYLQKKMSQRLDSSVVAASKDGMCPFAPTIRAAALKTLSRASKFADYVVSQKKTTYWHKLLFRLLTPDWRYHRPGRLCVNRSGNRHKQTPPDHSIIRNIPWNRYRRRCRMVTVQNS
jgi:hypothetical protein